MATQQRDVLTDLFKTAMDHFQRHPTEPCPPEPLLHDFYLALHEKAPESQLPAELQHVVHHVVENCGICYKKLWDWTISQDGITAIRSQNNDPDV